MKSLFYLIVLLGFVSCRAQEGFVRKSNYCHIHSKIAGELSPSHIDANGYIVETEDSVKVHYEDGDVLFAFKKEIDIPSTSPIFDMEGVTTYNDNGPLKLIHIQTEKFDDFRDEHSGYLIFYTDDCLPLLDGGS